MNNFKIPFVTPFKFYKRAMAGIHFDDKWYCKQIRSFEIKAIYRQKWIKSVKTKLQIESSLAPDDLKLLSKYGAPVKQFVWTEVVTGGTYKIWETEYDVTDVDDDIYYLYQRVGFGETIEWEAVSEPIHIAVAHINVIKFRYKNSFNKDDIAWTTGIDMTFMCEADIQDFEPDSDETDYINENHDTKTLDNIPSRQFQLYIGDTRNGASGVAPYIVDILNRIFACDYIMIEDKRYDNKSGSKFKVTRVRGYPLIGASLELVESFNSQSLEFADTTPFADGFIAGYNIETGFFGPGNLLPVQEVIENG